MTPPTARTDLPLATPPVPPLEDGQRLGRQEFESRYFAMPETTRAELIEGVVYMPSPVSFGGHGEQHFALATWLGVYMASTPGVRGGDNSTVRLDDDNEPQPDLCLLIDPARGGNARIDADDYISGAPELLVEIARTSVQRDLGPRLTAYQRNGDREYLVWRVEDREIDWFALRDGQFVKLGADEHGVLRSEVFPGLWLDTAAALAGDVARVLAVLQQGLTTPAHAAFVARLQRAAASQ